MTSDKDFLKQLRASMEHGKKIASEELKMAPDAVNKEHWFAKWCVYDSVAMKLDAHFSQGETHADR